MGGGDNRAIDPAFLDLSSFAALAACVGAATPLHPYAALSEMGQRPPLGRSTQAAGETGGNVRGRVPKALQPTIRAVGPAPLPDPCGRLLRVLALRQRLRR